MNAPWNPTNADRVCLPDATIIHFLDSESVIFSKGRRVTHVTRHGIVRIRLPFCFPRDLCFGFRLAERLLRADKCLCHPFRGGVVVIRGGIVYYWTHCESRRLGGIAGDTPLHRSACIGVSGSLYFGEYFMNPDRGEVKIWRVTGEAPTLEVAWRFSPGALRHVHGIYEDPFVPQRIWVTVGDLCGECYFYFTDDEFASIHRIGDGSQLWRAVGLMFSESHLLWGTDSPSMPNAFMAMCRETGQVTRMQEVDGTVWYAGRTLDGWYFASSSVENGLGVTTDQARVWLSRDGFKWTCAASFRKDWLPMPLFKWGTISFPAGYFPLESLWIFGEAIQGLDGRSMLLRVRVDSALQYPGAQEKAL